MKTAQPERKASFMIGPQHGKKKKKCYSCSRSNNNIYIYIFCLMKKRSALEDGMQVSRPGAMICDSVRVGVILLKVNDTAFVSKPPTDITSTWPRVCVPHATISQFSCRFHDCVCYLPTEQHTGAAVYRPATATSSTNISRKSQSAIGNVASLPRLSWFFNMIHTILYNVSCITYEAFFTVLPRFHCTKPKAGC